MIFLAHQFGHTVDDGSGPPPIFVSDGTHTRMTYSHRRQRRPGLMAVLTWMF